MDEQMIERLHEWHDEAVDLGYDEMHVPTEWITTVFAAHSVIAARVAELEGLIRECRLADAYAARTGDELRWDRAFHDLCRAERRAALAPHPKARNE